MDLFAKFSGANLMIDWATNGWTGEGGLSIWMRAWLRN
jgi:hypothetical protein